jgi:hypothetical protein
LHEKGADFLNLVNKEIDNKRFDLLMISNDLKWPGNAQLIERNYVKTDSLKLNMYHTDQDWLIYIWKPKVGSP